MVFVVLYKIDESKKDYTALFGRIKGLGEWAHYLDSAWLLSINGQKTPNDVYNDLIPFIDGETDYILIIQVTRNYYGWLPKELREWLEQRSF